MKLGVTLTALIDIQPGNWLFTIPNLDSFSEEELTMDVEESKVELFKKDWSDIPQYTPDYLAASLPLYLDMDLSEGFTVKISDMGGGELWYPHFRDLTY